MYNTSLTIACSRPSKVKKYSVREHDRIVAVDNRLEPQQAEPIEREDHLDQQRAGEQDTDKGRRETRDHDQHGVAEDMAVQHAVLGQPLGARRDDDIAC